MQRGVMYGVLAGAIWGMIFLVPRTLADFSPLIVSVGRYLMYGAVSLLLALSSARSLIRRLTRADLADLARLALIGNLLYYALVSSAVHLIGIAPTSLIVGVLPVTVTLCGRGDRGAAPLARLVWPLGLVLAGIVCINVDVFTQAPAVASHAIAQPVLFGLTAGSVAARIVGVLCATGALVAWTWYAVENTRCLRRQDHFTGNEWSVLWGVVTGALGLVLWLALSALPSGAIQGAVADGRWQAFWITSLVTAAGASWIGNGLWNAASRRLPLTLSGQLIVAETLFALLYGFIYDARLPRPLEIAAIVLLAAGVSWSIRCHSDGGGSKGATERKSDKTAGKAQAAGV